MFAGYRWFQYVLCTRIGLNKRVNSVLPPGAASNHPFWEAYWRFRHKGSCPY